MLEYKEENRLEGGILKRKTQAYFGVMGRTLQPGVCEHESGKDGWISEAGRGGAGIGLT